MATSTFVLKEPDAQRETLIYLIIRENGQRLKYSTGEKIHPDKWDAIRQRLNANVKLSATEKAINTQLARYAEAFDLLNSDAKIKGQPLDLDQARAYLNKEFTNRPQVQPLSFIGFAQMHHDTANRKVQTKKSYTTTINTLAAYQRANRKGKPLMFADIDLDFYADFVEYCKGQDWALNTIGSHIKNIKVFMDAAFEKDLHKNTAYKSKGFKMLAESVDSIYLSEEELELIYKRDFTKNAKLDRVRDLFIIASRTGLRFGDLRNLTPDKILHTEQGEIIQIQTKKTGQTVYIPLHSQTREILAKYNYKLPRVLSNQKFNEYVKEVARQAGILSTTTLTKTKGGERTETIKPKAELVTVHTARRTFATLAYKAGIQAQSIMKITGHRTERSFQAYIKLTNREHAILMAKHDFFKPKLKVVS